MTLMITQLFLFFTQAQVLLPLILIGFFFWDRKLVVQATSLLFLSMLLNTFLKGWMQLPQTYESARTLLSFPSGHMQAALAIYGWIAYKKNDLRVRTGIGVLLTGIAWSLVQRGFHTWVDVLGAVGFFIPLVFSYALLLRYEEVDPKRNESFVLFGILGFATLSLLALKQQGSLLPHVFVAYYSLLGLLTASKWVGSLQGLRMNFVEKCVAFLISASGIGLVDMMFKNFPYLNVPMSHIQWLFIGAWIPMSLKIVAWFKERQMQEGTVDSRRVKSSS